MTNEVIRRGTPMKEGRRLQATDANAIPGRLAIRGTSGDTFFQVCGDEGTPVGVIGWESSGSAYRTATPTTAYAANNIADILTGNFVWYAHLAASQGTVTKGDRLVPAANGTLKVQVAAQTYVAIADDTVTNSGAIQRIYARLVN